MDQEVLAKLTTELAGDQELYNTVINTFQEKEREIQEKQEELEQTKAKLEETEKRNQQYLGQISNLLSKIPVGNTETPKSWEDKVEEIKNRSWDVK